MNDASIGMLLLVLAGVTNASFTLPMKFTRRWAWENTWLAWTIFALLVLPPVVTLLTVPHLRQVYGQTGTSALLGAFFFGAGWGVAQVFFGIAVESIGIALTFSLVLGTSAAMGTIVPLLRLHPERVHTTPGHLVIGAVLLVLVGVAICAFAGRARERVLHLATAAPGKGNAGLILALLCGLGASFVNFGLTFGAPLITSAKTLGASPLMAPNAVWLPLMAAGAIPNLAYCAYLMRKNHTRTRFGGGGVSHWTLAFVMAAFWFGSTLLYGAAAERLGSLGPILGWPLFMSLIVITASLLGIFTGEWKNTGKRPLATQLIGVTVLVVAVFMLARASQLIS